MYWGLGGSVGLAESAGATLADERPGWFVAVGLYGVALLLLSAGGLALLLARGRRWRPLPLLALGVGAVLLVRAVLVEVLLLADAGYGGGAISPAQRSWALLLWNPWFLAGGIVFCLAAVAARRERGAGHGRAPRT